MTIVALLSLMASGLSGLLLVAIFTGWDGHRRTRRSPRGIPFGAVIAHGATALIAFVTWLVYVVVDRRGLAVVAAVLVGVTGILGGSLFGRWLPHARRRVRGTQPITPEQALPVGLVAVHGIVALSTVLLVVSVALAG